MLPTSSKTRQDCPSPTFPTRRTWVMLLARPLQRRHYIPSPQISLVLPPNAILQRWERARLLCFHFLISQKWQSYMWKWLIPNFRRYVATVPSHLYEGINLAAQRARGIIELEQEPIEGEPQKVYVLAVEIHPAKGSVRKKSFFSHSQFWRSKIVTFRSRYVFSNSLGIPVHIMQGTNFIYPLDPDAC